MSDDATSPRFSVVIPTYQRRDVVVASVAALGSLNRVCTFEVIVVVDGSNDGSAGALRALSLPFHLTVLEQTNQGRASACNLGAALARGDLLLFLDDDMEVDPSLLEEHDRSHREGADVVLGHIPLHPESRRGFLSVGVGEWAERRAETLRRRGGRLDLEDLLTGQMSLRRETFARLGGFDGRFTRDGSFGGEDLDLGQRLVDSNQRIVFNPSAVSRQRYVVTPRQYLRQWHQVGQADVALARKHPERAAQIFRRRESRLDRVGGRRPLRWLLREGILALAVLRPSSARVGMWFYRVRNIEYFRGIRAAGGPLGRWPVLVLCYHSISDLGGEPVLEPYGIPPRRFRRQISLLARRFQLLDGEEFASYLRGGGVPRRAVLLTFDDCYRDLLETAVPILREFDAPALAFAVTGRTGGSNDWDAPLGAPRLPLLDAESLRVLRASRVSVGSHSRSHRMLNRLSADELAGEIEGSLQDLERLGVGRPRYLAYPHGEHSAEVRRAAAAAGLEAAFTVEPGLVSPADDVYALPRVEILRADSGIRFLRKLRALSGAPASPASGTASARRRAGTTTGGGRA